MLPALTLLAFSTAIAGDSGLITWSHGKASIRRSASCTLLDSGAASTSRVTVLPGEGTDSLDQLMGSLEGLLQLEGGEGYLYLQGSTATASAAVEGSCIPLDDTLACDVTAVALGNDGCWDAKTTFDLTATDQGWEACLGATATCFRVEIDGVDAGHYMELGLTAHASTSDTELDREGTLSGWLDPSTGYVAMSWWGADLCDGFVILQEGACTVAGAGRVLCGGDADLHTARTGVTTVGWSYGASTANGGDWTLLK